MPRIIEIVVMVVGLTAVNVFAQYSEGSWHEGFLEPGLPRSAGLLAVVDGDVIAAGEISNTGPRDLYRYDGLWHGLGVANQRIHAMVEWDGGLLIAGEFSSVAGVPCRKLAFWNGEAWSEFGGGLVGESARALLVVGGDLYVGGQFSIAGSVTARNIAAWRTDHWEALAGGVPWTVSGVVLYGGQLVAGQYASADTEPGQAPLEVWNGSAWSQPLPLPPFFTKFIVAAADQIVVAGESTLDYHDVVCLLVDGAWQEIEISDEPYWRRVGIDALAMHGGLVHLAYHLSGPYISYSPHLQKWTGSALVDFSPTQIPDAGVHAMLSRPGELLIGGLFNLVGGMTAIHVAGLDSTFVRSFHQPSDGFTGSVSILAAYGPTVIVGGELGTCLAGPLGMVATGFDDGWWSLGIEDYYEQSFDHVRYSELGEIAIHPPHAGIAWNETYVTHSGLSSLSTHLIYDGASGGTTGGHCLELAYYDGRWVRAMEEEHYSTETVLVGVNGTFAGGSIYEMIPCTFGLAVGGSFTSCNGLARQGVTIWDGGQWLDLAGGLEGTVRDLVEWEGGLVVAGAFTIVQSGQAAQIAAWDGSTWEAMATDADDEVRALVVHQGHLLAGGDFTQVQSRPVRRLMIRDASGNWQEFGGGLDGLVKDLASSDDGLWASGEFAHAGAVESHRIALWHGDLVPVEIYNLGAWWVGDETEVRWWTSVADGGRVFRVICETAAGRRLVGTMASAGAAEHVIRDLAPPATGGLYLLETVEPDGDAVLVGEVPLARRASSGIPAMALRILGSPSRQGVALAVSLDSALSAALEVFDLRGHLVRRLWQGAVPAGERRIEWDGRDDSGRLAPAGTYVARLNADGQIVTGKLALVR